MYYYGYINKKLAYEMARVIVDCLGGGDKAVRLIVETAYAETGLGRIKDRTIYAGMGLTQFDNRPFYTIKSKSKRFRRKILDELGIDLDLLQWTDLRYNPFLALLFTRLYYLSIIEEIPKNIKARAEYWKKYYNTYAGKGTVEHYLKMNRPKGIGEEV